MWQQTETNPTMCVSVGVNKLQEKLFNQNFCQSQASNISKHKPFNFCVDNSFQACKIFFFFLLILLSLHQCITKNKFSCRIYYIGSVLVFQCKLDVNIKKWVDIVAIFLRLGSFAKFLSLLCVSFSRDRKPEIFERK